MASPTIAGGNPIAPNQQFQNQQFVLGFPMLSVSKPPNSLYLDQPTTPSQQNLGISYPSSHLGRSQRIVANQNNSSSNHTILWCLLGAGGSVAAILGYRALVLRRRRLSRR